MISDRYDSSNDMNPAIDVSNHPEVPYIYEPKFTKFEKSFINLVESNIRYGKLFGRLDINGTGKWEDIDLTCDRRTYKKKDSGGDGIKVRYILHLYDRYGRYVDALKFLSDHWIPNVSEFLIAKLSCPSSKLDVSEMTQYAIKISVSKDVERRFDSLHLTSEDRGKFNETVVHFISGLISRISGAHNPTNEVLVWVGDHAEWKHVNVDVKNLMTEEIIRRLNALNLSSEDREKFDRTVSHFISDIISKMEYDKKAKLSSINHAIIRSDDYPEIDGY